MKALASFFWHGAPLSPYEQACLRSFVRQGFEVQLFCYDADRVLPAGVRRRDARDYFAVAEVHSYEHGGQRGSIAAFADVLRASILAAEGGWWFDTDVYCLQDVEAYRQRFAGLPQVFGLEAPGRVNNAVLYFEPGSPHARQLRDRALAQGKRRLRWGALGPRLLTEYLRESALLVQAQPAQTFYPIDCAGAPDLLQPARAQTCAERCEPALAVHWWNELYRRWGLPKQLAPPPGSFLRQCIEREGIPLPDAGCTPELIDTLIAGFEARRRLQKWRRLRAALRWPSAESA
ncbi:MAG TPA: capsular polysaccharide synthesis protein [Fontimonas sp.]